MKILVVTGKTKNAIKFTGTAIPVGFGLPNC